MKNSVLFLFAVILFSACKKNNTDDKQANGSTENLIGKWRLEHAYHAYYINPDGTPYGGVPAFQDDMASYPSCYSSVIHEFRRDTITFLSNKIILDYQVNNAESVCPFYKTDGEPVQFWTFKFAIKTATAVYWELRDNNQTLRMSYIPKDDVVYKDVDMEVTELTDTKFKVKGVPVTVSDLVGNTYTYKIEYVFFRQ